MPDEGLAPPAYEGTRHAVAWRGVKIPKEMLDTLRGNGLRERLYDLTFNETLIIELNALASTEMATEFISELLESQPDLLGWEIGEALAELLLENYHSAVWPWNSTRDRRTPRASLPGADLVGFVIDPEGPSLLFGEVKTSSDKNAPPGVLTGRSGMIHQLEKLCSERGIHFQLLKWLRARCDSEHHYDLYRRAAQRFVSSKGRDFRLVGCLMRDTTPNELDLKNRGVSLSGNVASPTRAELYAWYLPDNVSNWPMWLEVPSDD